VKRNKLVNDVDSLLRYFCVLMPGGLSDFFEAIGRGRTSDDRAPRAHKPRAIWQAHSRRPNPLIRLSPVRSRELGPDVGPASPRRTLRQNDEFSVGAGRPLPCGACDVM
jgi:hypothetical protein